MKLEVFKAYIVKDISAKGLKISYDKTPKKRPAWMWVEGLPQGTTFINVLLDGKRQHYKVYLSPRIPLFLPVNYTKDEMRRFYNKFSEIYDDFVVKKNIPAANFLLKNIRLQKDAKILDLGAGTGLGSIPFVEAGYKNITLLDYSAGMLAKAKRRKELKGCKFVQQDVRKLNLKEKYDLIISIFSFAGNTYLDENEMPGLWRKVTKYLKPKAKIALLGYDYEPPIALFTKLKGGLYDIGDKNLTKWFIGEKK